MRNIIPQFIHDQALTGHSSGSLEAAAMFMDISGFTPLTEAMMAHGKEGVEVLNGVLNGLFGPIIDAVHQQGGFISGFAGDAFTALFPFRPDDAYCLSAGHSARAIQHIFQHQGRQQTKFGEFVLSVKTGLSQGRVEWGIVGEEYKTWFFRGPAVSGCARAEKLCAPQEIIVDKRLLERLQPHCAAEPVPGKPGWHKLLDVAAPDRQPFQKQHNITLSVARQFLPEGVLAFHGQGEFRDIACVFISFKEPETYAGIQSLASVILEHTRAFGGFLEGLDFADKGATCLLIFGAPLAHEDTVARAVACIHAIRRDLDSLLRAGVTSGTVFAGIKGSAARSVYGVLGDVVNLSARMMTRAGWGEVWLSAAVRNSVGRLFYTSGLGTRAFKGKSRPLPMYSLREKKQEQPAFFHGTMQGRAEELLTLERHCRPILDGRFAGVVYVYGEAGIGKSRLVYEASRLQPFRDCRTVVLQADNMLKKSFNAFVYAIRPLFGQDSGREVAARKRAFDRAFSTISRSLENRAHDRGTAGKVRAVLEELARTRSCLGALLGLHWPDSLYERLDAKGRYQNTLYALKALVKALSLIQPLFLVLEDLQWLDDASQAALAALCRNVADYPFAVVATSRLADDGSKPVLNVESQKPARELELGSLDERALDRFILERLGKPADSGLARLVWEKSHGNPFFAEQVVLYLQENGLLLNRDGTLSAKETALIVPGDINALLVARLDRLHREVKQVVQTAAVLGREFELRVLSEMLLLDDLLRQKVAHAEQARIWSALSEMKYLFTHALMCDCAYEMQLRASLRGLHKLAAQAFEKVYAADLTNHYADIALHYEQAGIADKAVFYLEKAGDHARDNYKNTEALSLYDRLLALIDYRNRTDLYLDTLFKQGNILDVMSQWDKAILLLQQALDRVKHLDADPVRTGRLTYRISICLFRRGRIPEAYRLFQRIADAMRHARHREGKDLYALALNSLGLYHAEHHQWDQAVSCYKACMRLCKRTGNLRALGNATGNLGLSLYSRNEFHTALTRMIQALAVWHKIKDKREYAAEQVNIANVLKKMGQVDQALACYEEVLAVCREMGDKRIVAGILHNMGLVYADTGDVTSAIAHYQAAREINLEIGYTLWLFYNLDSLGEAYKSQGAFDKALKMYQAGEQVCRESGNTRGRAAAFARMAMLFYDMEVYERAIQNWDKAAAIYERLGARREWGKQIGNTGLVYLNTGQYAKALTCFQAQNTVSRAVQYAQGIRISLGNMGQAYAGLQQYDKAIAAFQEKAESAEKQGDRTGHASALSWLADVYTAMGEEDKARACREQADMLQPGGGA